MGIAAFTATVADTITSTPVFGDHANLAVGYAPTTGDIDIEAETLPPGEFTLNGSYNWNGNYNNADGDWSFSLQTTEPLAWDGCDEEDWLFESGQLQGAISARQTVGFTVDYAGCGVPGTITAYGLTASRRSVGSG